MRISKILNIEDYYYDVFMSVSDAITGFSIDELQATGMGTEYYNHILGSMEAATFVEFLNVSRSILEASYSENQLNDAIAANLIADPGMQTMTGKIITLWYLGTWDGKYVNSTAYTEGLVWKIMESHPPGAKQPGFKSWGVQPINS